jgi:hypothetical protein
MIFFLSQGKYTVGILKKFNMTEYKSMPTLMVMDLKKMNDDSDEIDPQLIGSLMYLVNTRPDICYVVNVLKPSHETTETNSLDNNKTCIEIPTKHNWIWHEICLQCRLDLAGICRCRLGREYSGLEEHIQLLFTLGFSMVSWYNRK